MWDGLFVVVIMWDALCGDLDIKM